MSSNHFNAIVILDAIQTGDTNTALRLKEELQDIASYGVRGLQVLYARIETTTDLETILSDLYNKIRTAGLKPLLHLEGHGLSDETGFILADGSPCSWQSLKELITPLNIAMELNLLLVMATCFGGSFATAMTTTDRAPVWGLIGPTAKITAGQVETSFQSFDNTFFNSLSTSEALKALNDSAPHVTYFITVAEQFFYAVWKGYKKSMCSNEMIEKRAARMRHKAIYDKVLSNSTIGVPSADWFKQLRSEEHTS